MRVNVICGGRWRSPDLAAQLERMGYLGRYYTTKPRWALREPRDDRWPDGRSVRALVWPELVLRAAKLLGRRAATNADWFKTLWFQRWAAQNQVECDIVHAWAGGAKAVFGSITEGRPVRVLDRSSAHRLASVELLRDEYSRYGEVYDPDPRGIENELAEYELADAVLVPSRFALGTFLEQGYPAQKLFRVPFGTYPRALRPVRRPNEDQFRVLYVGALTVPKGFRYLLEAVELLGELPGLQVLVVGPRPDEHIAPLVSSCPRYVQFLGYRTRTDLHSRLYPQADVLVQPSILEGFSSVIREALSHGLPVVVTENTGGADVISDGVEGFVVPIRAPEAIAERLFWLYTHRDILVEMGKRAHQKARTQLTWEGYADGVVAMYYELLRRR